MRKTKLINKGKDLECLWLNKNFNDDTNRFNTEVFAKYYEIEGEEENLNINLNEGMEKYTLLICFASLSIGFLFIAISASIFLQCGK